MAKFEWNAPISAVHGRLWKGMGAAKRRIANADGEQPNYSVSYGSRDLTNHPITEHEQSIRDKFKAIALLVAARRKNAQKRVQDAVAFQNQTTYKTLTSYLWSICTAEYLADLQED